MLRPGVICRNPSRRLCDAGVAPRGQGPAGRSYLAGVTLALPAVAGPGHEHVFRPKVGQIFVIARVPTMLCLEQNDERLVRRRYLSAGSLLEERLHRPDSEEVVELTAA